jgi:hypothetical protein
MKKIAEIATVFIISVFLIIFLLSSRTKLSYNIKSKLNLTSKGKKMPRLTKKEMLKRLQNPQMTSEQLAQIGCACLNKITSNSEMLSEVAKAIDLLIETRRLHDLLVEKQSAKN